MPGKLSTGSPRGWRECVVISCRITAYVDVFGSPVWLLIVRALAVRPT